MIDTWSLMVAVVGAGPDGCCGGSAGTDGRCGGAGTDGHCGAGRYGITDGGSCDDWMLHCPCLASCALCQEAREVQLLCIHLTVMCTRLTVMCTRLTVMCIRLTVMCIHLTVMCIHLTAVFVQLPHSCLCPAASLLCLFVCL